MVAAGPVGARGLAGHPGTPGPVGPVEQKGDAWTTGAAGQPERQGLKGDKGRPAQPAAVGATGAATTGEQGLRATTANARPRRPERRALRGDTWRAGAQGDVGLAVRVSMGPQGLQGGCRAFRSETVDKGPGRHRSGAVGRLARSAARTSGRYGAPGRSGSQGDPAQRRHRRHRLRLGRLARSARKEPQGDPVPGRSRRTGRSRAQGNPAHRAIPAHGATGHRRYTSTQGVDPGTRAIPAHRAITAHKALRGRHGSTGAQGTKASWDERDRGPEAMPAAGFDGLQVPGLTLVLKELQARLAAGYLRSDGRPVLPAMDGAERSAGATGPCGSSELRAGSATLRSSGTRPESAVRHVRTDVWARATPSAALTSDTDFAETTPGGTDGRNEPRPPPASRSSSTRDTGTLQRHPPERRGLFATWQPVGGEPPDTTKGPSGPLRHPASQPRARDIASACPEDQGCEHESGTTAARFR